MSHRLVVSGPAACFRRPEFTNNPISYDVITPIAARRLFEAIHWTPALWWTIERIEVLRPIRFEWCELPKVIADTANKRSLCLVDVSYLLTARFELTATASSGDSAAQHAAMFKRRAKAQRFFRPPGLGGREYPAAVRVAAADEIPVSVHPACSVVDLGWMVFDRDPDNRDRLRYFRPTMIGGMIDLSIVEASTLPY